MKKLLLFLLVSIGLSAQDSSNISPHYNKSIIINTPIFQQQDVTYNDLTSVSQHFMRVFIDQMGLVEKSVSDKLDNDLNGVITYTYSQGIAVNNSMKRLAVNYKVTNYNNIHLVESVNITGDYILATKFYVRAFKTDFDLKETKNGIIIYNYGALDDMTFQYKNNLGIINIKNRQFKNIADFEKYRENSKKIYLAKKVEFDYNKAVQDNIETEQKQKYNTERLAQREFINKKLAEPKQLFKTSDVVYVTKKGDEFQIKKEYSNLLLTSIKECLKPHKNGVFSIYFKDINNENPICENIRKVK